VTEEIREEIKKFPESNENTTFQNLWVTAKAVQRGKFIAVSAYIKKTRDFRNKPPNDTQILHKKIVNFLVLLRANYLLSPFLTESFSPFDGSLIVSGSGAMSEDGEKGVFGDPS
jgi:hypothetical protein